MSKKKRRTFSAEFKLDTVMEAIRGEKSVAQICREREITDTMYYKWRDMFLEGAADVFGGRRGTARQESKERMAELERMLGRLTMENEILKKAKSWLDTPRR